MNLRNHLIAIKDLFTRRQKIFLIVMAGCFAGLGCLFLYQLRMHTYLIGDDPAACINCHVMTPYYATWSRSSHYRDATCNDCHVPHQNILKKYFFKGMDGMKHVGYFLTYSEHQAIRAEDASAEVIMDNCIRCHTQLNQEFVKTGRIDYMMAKRGEGLACWDCHRNVPHGGMNSLSSTPGAETQVPLPSSPVPEWIQRLVGNRQSVK
jgi:cytochrome c nitrite reductase small subunit